MNIIISGYGYVGKATEMVFNHHWHGLAGIQIQDPYLDMVADGWDAADYHMVCVPTPSLGSGMGCDGHDMSMVRDALHHARICGFNGTTVIRSTMSPLDLDGLKDLVGPILVWPEFLRKSSYEKDALSPLLSIIGGDGSKDFQMKLPGYRMMQVADARAACMAKLAVNSYLSMRTVVANDLCKACDAIGVDWISVRSTLAGDPRLGAGHWDQPGPDGKYGFGGGCLPKDTSAMSKLMQNIGNEESYAAWATDRNRKLR